jgi:hypothetical protein
LIEDLFGSKTRVKLLYLFLNNPSRSFYVREITRIIDEQINSVRRELQNMLEVGVILSDSKNNRLYYAANQAYQFYQPLKTIFADAEPLIARDKSDEPDDFTKKIMALGDIKLAIIAGKLVPGSVSDVDLLVVGNVVRVRLKNLIKNLEQERGVALNYSTMDEIDFTSRYVVRDAFIMGILDAKHSVLIDKDNIIDDK